MEVVGAHIERETLPLEVFAHIEELGAHIGLKTGPERIPAAFAGDFHQAAGEVSVLHGGNAAHHFHRSHRLPVNVHGRSQGRCGIIAAHRSRAAKVRHLRRGQVGVHSTAAGKQLQHVLDA